MATWRSDYELVTKGWNEEQREKFDALARLFLAANFEGRELARHGIAASLPDYRVPTEEELNSARRGESD